MDLPADPIASPLVFHGNCLAGWQLSLELRLRESQGVDVALESLTYEVADGRTSQSWGGEMLDASALRSRYGEGAAGVPAHGARELQLAVRVEGPVRGPIVVSGEVRGRDPAGALRESFRLSAAQVVVITPALDSGGACAAP